MTGSTRRRRPRCSRTRARIIPDLETSIRQTENTLSHPARHAAARPRAISSATRRAEIPARPRRSRSASRPISCGAGPTCASPSASSPRRARRSASPRPTCCRASRSSARSSVAAEDFPDLFEGRSFESFGGPSFRWAILNYGRITNNVRVQDARYQALIGDYETTVLRAQAEVENALAAYLGAQQRLAALERERRGRGQGRRPRRRSSTARAPYDYTRVLNTQQFLVTEQDRLVDDARAPSALSLTALYKALGGGWEIRMGQDFVSDDATNAMRARTRWGGMLDDRRPAARRRRRRVRHRGEGRRLPTARMVAAVVTTSTDCADAAARSSSRPASRLALALVGCGGEAAGRRAAAARGRRQPAGRARGRRLLRDHRPHAARSSRSTCARACRATSSRSHFKDGDEVQAGRSALRDRPAPVRGGACCGPRASSRAGRRSSSQGRGRRRAQPALLPDRRRERSASSSRRSPAKGTADAEIKSARGAARRRPSSTSSSRTSRRPIAGRVSQAERHRGQPRGRRRRAVRCSRPSSASTRCTCTSTSTSARCCSSASALCARPTATAAAPNARALATSRSRSALADEDGPFGTRGTIDFVDNQVEPVDRHDPGARRVRRTPTAS